MLGLEILDALIERAYPTDMQSTCRDSIHAAVRAATCPAARPGLRPIRFNPRGRAGRDENFGTLATEAKVSIHAAVRAATSR